MPEINAAGLSLFTRGQIAADDPSAARAVAGALDAVRAYCQWHVVGERDETLILDGSGTQELALPSTHVLEISRVVEDDEELAPSAYRWSGAGLIRKRVGCWSNEYRSVEVTLRHGYESAEDVADVVYRAAARALANPMTFTSEGVGEMTFGHGSIGGGFFDEEYRTLEPYRAVI
ncbi:head-tail adaptor [Gordonia phage Catfish]|uniref:Head-to-tail connector complex protein n=1 Tax=Gordonia phage Catfish TaxID=2301538 RepID=A0A385D0J4_9CAUD|nr:head-tail adaptor [Gordonia phage Catfish]AXQ51848.1 head-to-tail connector complex protein [Gordonia phage Catfish]